MQNRRGRKTNAGYDSALRLWRSGIVGSYMPDRVYIFAGCRGVRGSRKVVPQSTPPLSLRTQQYTPSLPVASIAPFPAGCCGYFSLPATVAVPRLSQALGLPADWIYFPQRSRFARIQSNSTVPYLQRSQRPVVFSHRSMLSSDIKRSRRG